jgi:hypothetical protein
MTSDSTQQTMKAATAAKKLGIHLPSAPEEFRSRDITRAELNDLLSTPPAWLEELKKSGPHPRPVVAAKLGVSISGLARGDVTDALTTAQIQELLANPPAWLVRERATQAQVRSEKIRIKERAAAKQERAEH